MVNIFSCICGLAFVYAYHFCSEKNPAFILTSIIVNTKSEEIYTYWDVIKTNNIVENK